MAARTSSLQRAQLIARFDGLDELKAAWAESLSSGGGGPPTDEAGEVPFVARRVERFIITRMVSGPRTGWSPAPTAQ